MNEKSNTFKTRVNAKDEEDEKCVPPVVEDPPKGSIDLFGEDGFKKASQFADLIVKEGELRGLIGPRELPRIWTRHIVNSAAVSKFFAKGSAVADLGAGAGFPGIVVALMRPDLRLSLIEPMDRRCKWLADVCAELELENVEIINSRAQEIKGKKIFDSVTCRAVASMDKLVEWAFPLLKKTGSLVALKGEKAEQEIENVSSLLKKEGAGKGTVEEVTIPGCSFPARVVIIPKSKKKN